MIQRDLLKALEVDESASPGRVLSPGLHAVDHPGRLTRSHSTLSKARVYSTTRLGLSATAFRTLKKLGEVAITAS
jgi:hypothetical protein